MYRFAGKTIANGTGCEDGPASPDNSLVQNNAVLMLDQRCSRCANIKQIGGKICK